MPMQVYCRGRVVDVISKDGRFFCSCCSRELSWLADYLDRRSRHDLNPASAGDRTGQKQNRAPAGLGAGQ